MVRHLTLKEREQLLLLSDVITVRDGPYFYFPKINQQKKVKLLKTKKKLCKGNQKQNCLLSRSCFLM